MTLPLLLPPRDGASGVVDDGSDGDGDNDDDGVAAIAVAVAIAVDVAVAVSVRLGILNNNQPDSRRKR